MPTNILLMEVIINLDTVYCVRWNTDLVAGRHTLAFYSAAEFPYPSNTFPDNAETRAFWMWYLKTCQWTYAEDAPK